MKKKYQAVILKEVAIDIDAYDIIQAEKVTIKHCKEKYGSGYKLVKIEEVVDEVSSVDM